jgi:hypothetical protein
LNVQFKADIDNPAGGKMPSDYKRLVQILRDGGYQGWVALEYESADPAGTVPKHLKILKELMAG